MWYRHTRLYDDLWWRILFKLMASRPLLTNESLRKEHLSISPFLMATGSKSLWRTIYKTNDVSLYHLNSDFIPWCFTKWPIIYTEAVRYASHSLDTISTTPFKITLYLVQLMFGKPRYKSEFKWYKLTLFINTINVVVTTIEFCSSNSRI
jgi:hypothetical protein